MLGTVDISRICLLNKQMSAVFRKSVKLLLSRNLSSQCTCTTHALVNQCKFSFADMWQAMILSIITNSRSKWKPPQSELYDISFAI